MDLYVAGVSETRLPGAAVGPTFGCLIGINFQRFMHADRFWFETSNPLLGFTQGKLLTKSLIFVKLIIRLIIRH